MKRLKGQLKRLKDKHPILKAYDAIIKDQEECRVIEKVTVLETHEKIHYLPHHAVIRIDSKTTKVRIVYDASSKEGVCHCLHVRPTLSPLLYNILISLRAKPVALVGDIEKVSLIL